MIVVRIFIPIQRRFKQSKIGRILGPLGKSPRRTSPSAHRQTSCQLKRSLLSRHRQSNEQRSRNPEVQFVYKISAILWTCRISGDSCTKLQPSYDAGHIIPTYNQIALKKALYGLKCPPSFVYI
jgi:hypothetical protein